MKTKYIIIARDRTLEHSPKRVWIFDNKEKAMEVFNFLTHNTDFTLPEWSEVEGVIINEECI